MYDGVILLSGGLDSTVLAYYLASKGKKLVALTFEYGQRTVTREIVCARRTAERLGMPHEIMQLPHVFRSKLTDGSGTYVVPNRNMVFIAIGISYALSNDIPKVYITAHKDDWTTFPDCRPEFLCALNLAAMLGNNLTDPIIEAPFLYMHRYEIIQLGHQLNVPFTDTWSCYESATEPCGQCVACKLRQLAFKQAGLKDPLR